MLLEPIVLQSRITLFSFSQPVSTPQGSYLLLCTPLCSQKWCNCLYWMEATSEGSQRCSFSPEQWGDLGQPEHLGGRKEAESPASCQPALVLYPENQVNTVCEGQVTTLHFYCGWGWCRSMLVSCHAGVNATVLRHHIANLQHELPRVTAYARNPRYKLLLCFLMLFIPVSLLPHYKDTCTQLLLTHLKEHPPSHVVPNATPAFTRIMSLMKSLSRMVPLGPEGQIYLLWSQWKWGSKQSVRAKFSSFPEPETPHLQKDFRTHSFLTLGGAVWCLCSMPNTNWTSVMQVYKAALWNRMPNISVKLQTLKQAMSRRVDISQQLGKINVSGT